jgi:hypothetical protein
MFPDPKTQPKEGGRFIPIGEIGLDLGGQGVDGGRRTTKRKIKTDPDFPPVYRLNNRLYVFEPEYAAYKAKLLQRGIAALPLAPHPQAPPNPRGRSRAGKSDPQPDDARS